MYHARYTTGVAIGIIVLINAGIAAWTEHKAGDALEALSQMQQENANVPRIQQSWHVVKDSQRRCNSLSFKYHLKEFDTIPHTFVTNRQPQP